MRRRDELTPLEAQIARERFPIPGEPVPARRGVLAELRGIDARPRRDVWDAWADQT